MQKTILPLCLLCCTAAGAAADAPTPTGLDLIQTRYAGTWHVEEMAYATEFSRPGSKQYDLTRYCVPTAAVLDCKLVADGTQQGEQRFTWDATDATYRVDMDIGGRSQPTLTLSVKAATWIFTQTVPGPDGKPIQLRILRQYRSASEVSYSASYSLDGTNWRLMTRGTELRKDKST